MTTALDEAPVWEQYSSGRRTIFLAVLFFVGLFSAIDRSLMSVLTEPIKREFHASDTVMGLLNGFAFALFYAVAGFPIARQADRGNRVTVITVSLAAWSAMSALCGAVSSVAWLALARVGVGVGEAGGGPPVQSILADYFPPNQRGGALAVALLAATFGGSIAYAGGAVIAAASGWRSAFIWVSLPGVPMALLAYWLLDEPRRRVRAEVARAAVAEPFSDAVRILLAKKSLIFAMLGATVYSMSVVGTSVWFPSYLERVLKINLIKAGSLVGLASLAGPLLGAILGGVFGDRLAKRNVKWRAWLPALGVLISLPLFELTLLTNNLILFTVLSGLVTLFLSASLPSILALFLSVAGGRRIALAGAGFGLLNNLIGFGLGPLLVGVISDLLTPIYGPVGLRYSMMTMTAFMLLSAGLFLAAAKWIETDLEP